VVGERAAFWPARGPASAPTSACGRPLAGVSLAAPQKIPPLAGAAAARAAAQAAAVDAPPRAHSWVLAKLIFRPSLGWRGHTRTHQVLPPLARSRRPPMIESLAALGEQAGPSGASGPHWPVRRHPRRPETAHWPFLIFLPIAFPHKSVAARAVQQGRLSALCPRPSGCSSGSSRPSSVAAGGPKWPAEYLS